MFFILGAFACSSGGTSSSGSFEPEMDAGPAILPSDDGGARTDSDAGSEKKDAGGDAALPDPKISFEATLDGKAATFTKVEVRPDGKNPTTLEIVAEMTQSSLPGGATGPTWISLIVNKTMLGAASCGFSSSPATLVANIFYNKNGTFTNLSSSDCDVNIVRPASGPFTEGTASGTMYGTFNGSPISFPFTLKWAQKTPPSP